MAALVAESESRLADTPGIGAVTAARLLGRTGNPTRFPAASAFAQYAGTAPIEIASAERARHRLSRRGAASSTRHSTPWRSRRSACPARGVTPTTRPSSPKERPFEKHNAA
ncbi:transposase [Streptomyces sp. NBC_00233]|uniref:transposase n=1 Tax=Streptomyces sp. NBC_00233 TaxID=2975686 RepID=UPI0022589EA7|nr:transposase [Streptomyces sp. NBC_00233]MCX5233068.1 IS110 family transposase [Streptomyces sp. NBC_00233]